MNRDKLKALYLKYELTAEDIFTKEIGEKSFTIITRQGIDKIQGIEKINISFPAVFFCRGPLQNFKKNDNL